MITDREFRLLRNLIHTHSGIALSEHKCALVSSRLAKRLRHHGLKKYSQYYDLLTQQDRDGTEIIEMINAITTNKTDFFRERHHFEFLSDYVFPELKQVPLHHGSRRIRIWSAGTASGEEAYSLAITVMEAFPYQYDWDIKILATDIDTNALRCAEEGIYPREHVKQLEESILHRYFLQGRGKHENKVMIKRALKTLVRFRHLNFRDDPWPMKTPFDVIFCRNVMIYFDKTLQHQLFTRFSQMLRPRGYLMLGHSELLPITCYEFSHLGRSIYQYTGKGAR